MRYTFVLSVFLCVGLASGFIVPTGVPKVHENKTSHEILKRDRVFSSNSTDIDEKSIYEHGTEKANNQNTRSSIFLNKGYVAPVRQIEEVKYEFEPNTKNYKIQSSLTDLELAHYSEFPNRFFTGSQKPPTGKNNLKTKSPKHNSVINILNKEARINNMYEKELNDDAQTQTIGNELRQYVLKPSFVKPQGDNIVTNNIGLSEVPHVHSPQCPKNHKYQNWIKQNSIEENPAKNFRDAAKLHLLQKSARGKNQFFYSPENPDFSSQLNRNGGQRYFGPNENLESSLHNIQKDSYGELFYNSKNTHFENCKHPGCIKSIGQEHKTTKQYCNCYIKRERQSREGLSYNDTTPLFKPSRNYDCDDSRDEDSINKIANDELLKTINKLNDTLEMYQ